MTDWFSIKEKLPLEGQIVLGIKNEENIFTHYFLCFVNHVEEWYEYSDNGEQIEIDFWSYLPIFEYS